MATWDWAAVNGLADEVLVVAGIAVMVVRQFRWRSAELHRLLRLPLLIIGAGTAYLGVELWGGFPWVRGDWFIVAELALVAGTGTVMGHVTRFRTIQGHLQYRLTAAGLWLWLAFVGIRLASFFLAAALGVDLAGATGLVLLSFGINRLAATLVVRRRARNLLARVPCEVEYAS